MSLKIKSASHSEQLVTGVARLLSDTTHRHSDVQLKVGENIFHCHKLVLAMKSPYFDETLFPSSSSSSSSTTTFDGQMVLNGLNDVSADDFEKVLRFIYIGETEINDKNVENILRAADLMELTELTQLCVNYLMDRLSIDTCPRYWKIGEQRSLTTVILECERLCLNEFVKIGSSSELSSLSETMMSGLLADDRLVVESEVDVCETLLKWLNSSAQIRNSVQPYHLLTHIRWSAVPLEYVQTKLITNNIVMRDRQSFEFLSKVISYRLTGVQFSGLNTFHRPSTGVEQCVLIVGGYEETDRTELVRVSLQKQDHFTSAATIPTTVKFAVAACVSGKEVYITGAGSDGKEAWKWEPATGWTRCADMNEPRSAHCATFVNDTSMYVLGGDVDDGNTILDSIEQYDTVTDSWTNVGRLIHATYHAACAVHKTSIYVIGGGTQSGEYLRRVQVFDAARKLCTELAPRLPYPTPGLRAVMWDRSVILVSYNTCLLFDLEQETFQRRERFAAGIMGFGLAVESGHIFVAGGVRDRTDADEEMACSDEVKSVNVMDIIDGPVPAYWRHHATLPAPAVVPACVVMTLQA